MKQKHTILRAALLAACILSPGAESCRRESVDPCGDEPVRLDAVAFGIEETAPLSAPTRSLLTDPDIETKTTGVTLAAYADGTLHVTRHFTSGFTAMPLDLVSGTAYDVYAFVNMGDVTRSVPVQEAALPGVFYSIPDYATVNGRGLPMTGCKAGFVAGTDPDSTVPVRRLFAKVTARLSCDWEGARITSVKVKNMNGLLPFWGSGSIATGAAGEVFAGEEQDQGNAASGTFVFYVPENLQGTVPGIIDPAGKSHEMHPGVEALRARLTYLETTVRSTGAYAGTVTYRSYLGRNATTDFNIEGNVRYTWTVRYHEDGLQEDSWKKDTGDLSDNRFVTLVNPVWAEPADTFPWEDLITSNLSLSALRKTFRDGDAIVGTVNDDAFTVKPTARTGQTATLTVTPTANPTPALTATSELRIVEKRVEWADFDPDLYAAEGKKIYRIQPGTQATAPVAFSFTWNGATSFERGLQGVKWDYAPATGTGIRSAFTAGSGPEADRLTYTADFRALPGDYPMTVSRLAPQTGSDLAYLRVDDTRYLSWIDCTDDYPVYNWIKSYDYLSGSEIRAAFDRDTYYTEAGHIIGDTFLQFTFGDSSGARRLSLTNINSLNIKDYLKVEFSRNGSDWSAGSDDFTLNWGVFFSDDTPCSITLKTKRALPSGVYGVRISFVDGSHPIVCRLHVEDVITHELRLRPATQDLYEGESGMLEARFYTLVNGEEDAYYLVDAEWSIPYNREVLSYESTSGSTFRFTDVWGGTTLYYALVEATAVVDGQTYVANGAARRGRVNCLPNTVVTSYELVPGSATLPIRGTQRFTVMRTDEIYHGSTYVRSTTYAVNPYAGSWGTDDATVAAMSYGSVTGVAPGSTTIRWTASDGETVLTAPVTVIADDVRYLIVLDPPAATVRVGADKAFTVNRYTDTYRDGIRIDAGTTPSAMDPEDFIWTTSAPGTASVDAGLVHGIAAGTATLTATLRPDVADYTSYAPTAVSASVTVENVTETRYELELSPDPATLGVGLTLPYTVRLWTVSYINGVETGRTSEELSRSSFQLSWESSNTAAATVSRGIATGVAAGTTTISVRYSGAACEPASARLVVEDRRSTGYALSLSPAIKTIAYGQTQDYTATLWTISYLNGVETGRTSSTLDSDVLSWESSQPAVASVSAGTATGRSAGTTTVTARYTPEGYHELTATASLTVINVMTTEYALTLDPTASSIGVGASQHYTATLWTITCVNGVETGRTSGTLAGEMPAWSSSEPAVASVSAGTATGLSAGTATITAAYNGKTASATLTVVDVPGTEYELLLSPASATLTAGMTRTYTATLRRWTLLNGTRVSSTDTPLGNAALAWSSSEPAVASVSAGTVTALAAGTTTITARYNLPGSGPLTATARLEVVEAGGIRIEDGWDDGGETIL